MSVEREWKLLTKAEKNAFLALAELAPKNLLAKVNLEFLVRQLVKEREAKRKARKKGKTNEVSAAVG